MSTAFSRSLCLLWLVFWLSSCAAVGDLHQQVLTQPNSTPLSAHPLYVLAYDAGYYLTIVDPSTWQVARRVLLFVGTPGNLSRDPQGRIWIGYGADPGGDRRVQVFAPDGTLLKTLSLCSDPYLKIHFATTYAFVPCLQNGFHAAVVVVDLQSLEPVKQIDISIDGDFFTLLATGGDNAYFVMVGGGKITNRVVFVDTHTLMSQESIAIPPSFPNSVLAYQGHFYLLNANPNSPPTGRQDLLILNSTASPQLKIESMAAAGALWGMIDNNSLYAYHNIEYGGLYSDPARAISRLDLVTHKSELWPLPNRWEARDLTIINGNIILTHSVTQEPAAQGGLYRFDPATGKLSLLVNIPGAERILPPAP